MRHNTTRHDTRHAARHTRTCSRTGEMRRWPPIRNWRSMSHVSGSLGNSNSSGRATVEPFVCACAGGTPPPQTRHADVSTKPRGRVGARCVRLRVCVGAYEEEVGVVVGQEGVARAQDGSADGRHGGPHVGLYIRVRIVCRLHLNPSSSSSSSEQDTTQEVPCDLMSTALWLRENG